MGSPRLGFVALGALLITVLVGFVWQYSIFKGVGLKETIPSLGYAGASFGVSALLLWFGLYYVELFTRTAGTFRFRLTVELGAAIMPIVNLLWSANLRGGARLSDYAFAAVIFVLTGIALPAINELMKPIIDVSEDKSLLELGNPAKGDEVWTIIKMLVVYALVVAMAFLLSMKIRQASLL